MRRLGNSDLLVSPVGLGGNNFGRPGTATATIDGTRAVIDAAIERGVVFIDTAELYGEPAGTSESLLGQALRGRRDQVVIATKFGYPDGGPRAHASRRRASNGRPPGGRSACSSSAWSA